MTKWAEEELGTLSLGDVRLDKRAVVLAEQLAQRPGTSIPQACGDWGQTQAAYRFLAHEASSGEAVLQAHAQASLVCMAAQPVVLCLQDTTELEFDAHRAQGLGPLSYEARKGMFVHPTYAVTPEREPLGLVNAWNWARQPRPEDGGERPGINDGVRWVESYAHLVGLAPQLATTRLVCVGDRESDTMALFEQAQRSGWAVDMLVRAQHDRVLPDAQAGKLWSRAMATEVDAPAGIKPVVWRLLSNRPVHTLEQAAYILNRKKPPK